jgi:signal transduction histidine kinase
MSLKPLQRILLIDDNPSIHEDFKKVLIAPEQNSSLLSDARAGLMGRPTRSEPAERQTASVDFELECALQGQEGLAMLEAALAEERPYAMAFVDIRMPPGWDGVRTIEELWAKDPELQVVICTAYSDYSWEETINRLGHSDRLLILKKPFDSIEILQLASALTHKWNMVRRERQLIESLKAAEQEAHAYASSLETVNRALMTAKASADKSSQMKNDYLIHLGAQIQEQMQSIFGAVHQLRAPEEMELAEIGRLDDILDASRYLISIFDDVLDMNLLENGDARPDSKSFRLLETLESEIESFRSLAREKGVALVLQRRGPLPEYLNSDEGRFRQVVSELLENAVRCTENGSIQVSVGMDQAHDWQEPILRIDVTDTGPGIPEHEVGMVFEPFYKRELPGDERLRPGLGLGLAKRASKLLGGDVVLETEVGRGSVFSFTCETGRLDGVRMLS